jgi:hypothetical protein
MSSLKYNPCMKFSCPCLFFLAVLPLCAAELPDVSARGIQDNSFLVEEAYNQEEGVVQHIFNLHGSFDRVGGQSARDWTFHFTEEWPVPNQRHQFSYMIPYTWLSGGGEPSVNGIGDIFLNYRYQALMETERLPAVAPRFSLILPTGDPSKGLGDDTVGYQFNLPVSKVVSDRWTLHGNAGLTFQPGVQGRDLLGYNLGASAIYAVTRRFNLMLEAVGEWNEFAEIPRHRFEVLLSPGLRYGLNFDIGQLVLGVAAPIGMTRDARDYAVFFYLSWEHGFLKKTLHKDSAK